MGAIALIAVAATVAEVAGAAALAEAAIDLGATDASLGAAGSLAAGEGGAGFLAGMSDVAATEGAGVSGTGISSGVAPTATAADAASTIDAAAQTNPVQSIKDSLKSVNAAIDSALPPGARQAINVGYQLSKGADPTQIIINSLKSQALGGIGSDIAAATGSKDLGQFASGTIGNLMSGRDPMKAIEGGALGVANSEFNTNLKEATGLTALPNFNITPLIDPDFNKPERSPLQTPTLDKTAMSDQTVMRPRSSFLGQTAQQDTSSGLQGTTDMPTLGLPQLGLQDLSLPSLGLPQIGPQVGPSAPLQTAQANLPFQPDGQLKQLYGSIGPSPMKDGGTAHYAGGSAVGPYRVPKLSSLNDYTQLYPTLTPTEQLVLHNKLVNPQEYELLSEEPVVYSAEGGEIHSKLIPELIEMLQKHAPKHYAGETTSSVQSESSIWDNPDVKKIDWKAMQEGPKFTRVFEPKLLQPKTRPIPPKLEELRHLSQGPLAGRNPLSMRAQGGLSKYHEAAPEGHHPEFITGITGYYAGGRGTGQSDDIPAMLHDGDYVMDAEAVSAFGDGSSKAGNEVLMKFMHAIPHQDHKQGKPVPAKIADGEVVLPEAFVTALGHGDNKRGAHMLDEIREELREHKRSAPTSKIPPKAKSPLDYLKMAKG